MGFGVENLNVSCWPFSVFRPVERVEAVSRCLGASRTVQAIPRAKIGRADDFLTALLLDGEKPVDRQAGRTWHFGEGGTH
jgi:hypothetical protein